MNFKNRVISEIERMKKNNPEAENILEAFRYLLVEQVCLKAETLLPKIPNSFKLDPIRFSQGIPLLMQENIGQEYLIQAERLIQAEDYMQTAAKRLFSAMKKGFPKIASELDVMETSMQNGQFTPDRIMEAILKQEENTIAETSTLLEMSPELIVFVTVQMMKPFMAKFAEAAASLIEGVEWHKGNCPVCGASPELSFLKTDVGQRWLRCSICSHSWRFIRTECPMCENSEPDKSEAVFIENMPHERAELCAHCKRYIITVDLRKYSEQALSETTAFGLLHLDMIAQEKGYSPMALSAWNVST